MCRLRGEMPHLKECVWIHSYSHHSFRANALTISVELQAILTSIAQTETYPLAFWCFDVFLFKTHDVSRIACSYTQRHTCADAYTPPLPLSLTQTHTHLRFLAKRVAVPRHHKNSVPRWSRCPSVSLAVRTSGHCGYLTNTRCGPVSASVSLKCREYLILACTTVGRIGDIPVPLVWKYFLPSGDTPEVFINSLCLHGTIWEMGDGISSPFSSHKCLIHLLQIAPTRPITQCCLLGNNITYGDTMLAGAVAIANPQELFTFLVWTHQRLAAPNQHRFMINEMKTTSFNMVLTPVNLLEPLTFYNLSLCA